MNFFTNLLTDHIPENVIEQMDESFLFMFVPFGIFFVIFISIFIIIILSIVKASKKQKEQRQRVSVQYADTVEKYYQIISNDPELSSLRNSIKTTHTIGLTMIIVGFLTFFIFTIISMAFIVAGIFIMNSKKNLYAKLYKGKIMKCALYEYDKELVYYPESGIPLELYKLANFESFDVYKSEDRINGKIAGFDFIMADVHVQDRRTDSDGDTHYVTLFDGPVAILDLPTPLNFNISILSNIASIFDKSNKVEIDNPQFEEIYNVYSNDQISTMNFLTPSITTKLIDLFNKYGFHFELKIFDNHVYFRFHSGNLFVPNPKDAREEAIGVALYFEILQGIKEIMNEVIVTIQKI